MGMERLENEYLIVEMDHIGAELRRIYSKRERREVLWNADEKYWGRVSPLLFPIIGKVKNDELKIGNVAYRLEKHGFVRDASFSIAEKSNHRVVFAYQSNEETRKCYPFDFELYTTFEIRNQSLEVAWIVKNCSDDTMWFSIGGHPAISMPHDNNGQLNEYSLVFKAIDEILEYSLNPPYICGESKIANPESLTMDSSLFRNDTLVYGSVDGITLSNLVRNTEIKIDFKGFPYVAIWSPTYDNGSRVAPFVCIEPWYGIPDLETASGKIDEKEGMQKLNRLESFRAAYTITVEKP